MDTKRRSERPQRPRIRRVVTGAQPLSTYSKDQRDGKKPAYRATSEGGSRQHDEGSQPRRQEGPRDPFKRSPFGGSSDRRPQQGSSYGDRRERTSSPFRSPRGDEGSRGPRPTESRGREGYGNRYEGSSNRYEGSGNRYEGSSSRSEGSGNRYGSSGSRYEGGSNNRYGSSGSRYGSSGNRSDYSGNRYGSPSGNRREGSDNRYGSSNSRYASSEGRSSDSYNNQKKRYEGGYNPNAKYSLQKQLKYKEALTDPNAPIRLNRFLANAGVCSRREADEYIKAGVVKVNGQIITELGTKISRADSVQFHDDTVQIESKLYVVLNKPKNYVTTTDDPQERKTVMELIEGACKERIYPVGRLDRNTTGVLLFTNDGDLASKLTHPSFKKKKIYHVWLDRAVTMDDLAKIADGIELEDGMIHADAVSYANETDKTQVGIEIHSGRNRIVRRMFESMGYHVIKLDRVYFAGLTKKNLPRGRWRYLNEREVNALRMGAFE